MNTLSFIGIGQDNSAENEALQILNQKYDDALKFQTTYKNVLNDLCGIQDQSAKSQLKALNTFKNNVQNLIADGSSFFGLISLFILLHEKISLKTTQEYNSIPQLFNPGLDETIKFIKQQKKMLNENFNITNKNYTTQKQMFMKLKIKYDKDHKLYLNALNSYQKACQDPYYKYSNQQELKKIEEKSTFQEYELTNSETCIKNALKELENKQNTLNFCLSTQYESFEEIIQRCQNMNYQCINDFMNKQFSFICQQQSLTSIENQEYEKIEIILTKQNDDDLICKRMKSSIEVSQLNEFIQNLKDSSIPKSKQFYHFFQQYSDIIQKILNEFCNINDNRISLLNKFKVLLEEFNQITEQSQLMIQKKLQMFNKMKSDNGLIRYQLNLIKPMIQHLELCVQTWQSYQIFIDRNVQMINQMITNQSSQRKKLKQVCSQQIKEDQQLKQILLSGYSIDNKEMLQQAIENFYQALTKSALSTDQSINEFRSLQLNEIQNFQLVLQSILQNYGQRLISINEIIKSCIESTNNYRESQEINKIQILDQQLQIFSKNIVQEEFQYDIWQKNTKKDNIIIEQDKTPNKNKKGSYENFENEKSPTKSKKDSLEINEKDQSSNKKESADNIIIKKQSSIQQEENNFVKKQNQSLEQNYDQSQSQIKKKLDFQQQKCINYLKQESNDLISSQEIDLEQEIFNQNNELSKQFDNLKIQSLENKFNNPYVVQNENNLNDINYQNKDSLMNISETNNQKFIMVNKISQIVTLARKIFSQDFKLLNNKQQYYDVNDEKLLQFQIQTTDLKIQWNKIQTNYAIFNENDRKLSSEYYTEQSHQSQQSVNENFDIMEKSKKKQSIDFQIDDKICSKSESFLEKKKKRLSILDAYESNNQISKKILSIFNIKDDNYLLVSSFSCAYMLGGILLQGNVYIFEDRICFYSMFNKSTIFFGTDTCLNIPIHDIIKIEKSKIYKLFVQRYNAKIFDNSISIHTQFGEIFLTSFVQRDKAFNLIQMVINPELGESNDDIIPDDQSEYSLSNNILSNDQSPTFINKNIDEQKITDEEKNLTLDENNDRQQIYQEIDFSDRINSICTDFQDQKWKDNFRFDILDMNLQEVYQCLFLDNVNNLKYNGKSFISFFDIYYEQIKDTQISVQVWTPKAPEYYNVPQSKNMESLINYPKFSEREVSYVHPVREKIPFGPTSSNIKEKQKIYWISDKKLILESEIEVSKVPFSDCFKIRKCIIMEQIDQNCQMQLSVVLNFVKSTYLQSVIERSTYSENKEIWEKNWVPTAQNIFKAYKQQRSKNIQQSQINQQSNNKITQDQIFNQQPVQLLEQSEDLIEIKQKLNDLESKLQNINSLESQIETMDFKLNSILALNFLIIFLVFVLYHKDRI